MGTVPPPEPHWKLEHGRWTIDVEASMRDLEAWRRQGQRLYTGAVVAAFVSLVALTVAWTAPTVARILSLP